jgi:hypothetical protein
MPATTHPIPRRAVRRALAAALLGSALLAPPPIGAQDAAVEPDAAGGTAIARRVAAAPDGFVHLSFPARDGVCGDGTSIRTGAGRSVI